MTPRERAKQIQWVGKTPKELWDEVEQAITAAVEEEREACAKMADVESHDGRPHQAEHIAEAIRARSSASDRSAAPAEK